MTGPWCHIPWRVGVDGGGSGTRARLHDRQGRTLGFGSAGPSGLGQGVAQAWRHVEAALAAAFDAATVPLPRPADVALGLGLAGAGVAAQRAAFLAADPGYAVCVLDTDAVTQSLGAHGGRPGIVVACGTGSVAAVRSANGSLRQVGGWGFPVGDEGSGAWLGLRAVQLAQATLDGRTAAGPLCAAVLDAIGVDPAQVLAWCAGAGQSRYAALAPLVFDAAGSGDATAARLLDQAAAELARLVAAADAAVATDAAVAADAADAAASAAEVLPIAVVGSVGERLLGRWPEALRSRTVAPQGDGADGALLLLQSALRNDSRA